MTMMNEALETRAIVQLPLEEIHADRDWNVRKFLGEDSDGGPDEHSFTDLVTSITDHGQHTAVEVRTNTRKDLKQKYLLVSGFRRFAAISKVYSEGKKIPGLTKGHIFAEVKANLTELEAIIQNGRENTGRKNLNAADTSFLVGRLVQNGMSPKEVASALALSEHYVYLCRQIHRDTTPLMVTLKNGKTMTVFDHWRESPGAVPFQVMVELCRLKADNRVKELKYMQLIAPKKVEETTEGKKKAVQKNEFAIAENFGSLIGRLVKAQLIQATDNWEAMLLEGKRISLEGRSEEYKKRVLMNAKNGFARGIKVG